MLKVFFTKYSHNDVLIFESYAIKSLVLLYIHTNFRTRLEFNFRLLHIITCEGIDRSCEKIYTKVKNVLKINQES